MQHNICVRMQVRFAINSSATFCRVYAGLLCILCEFVIFLVFLVHQHNVLLLVVDPNCLPQCCFSSVLKLCHKFCTIVDKKLRVRFCCVIVVCSAGLQVCALFLILSFLLCLQCFVGIYPYVNVM